MTLAVICMAFMPVGAQNKENAKQKLTPEQRIERQAENLSRRMLLDDATKAKFVPLYQEYMKEMQSVCPLQNNAQKKTKAELTDKELEERMEQCFDARQKRLDVEKKYYKKFKSVLNIRQLDQVFRHCGYAGRPAAMGKKAVPGARKMNKQICPMGSGRNQQRTVCPFRAEGGQACAVQ